MIKEKCIGATDKPISPKENGDRLLRMVGEVLGLWSLVKLQYEYEGHMNTEVYRLLDKMLFEFEEQLDEHMRISRASEPPF